MSTFYLVVEYGPDSGSPLALFSTEKLAEDYKAKCYQTSDSRHDRYRVEEFLVDEKINAEVYVYYICSIRLKTGKVENFTRWTMQKPSRIDTSMKSDYYIEYYSSVSETDAEEQALKIYEGFKNAQEVNEAWAKKD